MRKYLLGGKGKFYKANLHLHSTVSDGCWTPLEAKEEYQKRGYSILAFTDHEVMVSHNELSDENFLAITSYEAWANKPSNNKDYSFVKTYHFNFYSKNKNAKYAPSFNERGIFIPNSFGYITEEMRKHKCVLRYDIENINKIIKKANRNGFLVTLNHPRWSLNNYEDYSKLKGLWGVEVYNHLCQITGYEENDSPLLDLLRLGNNVVPIASDDTHFMESAFGGFTMIEANSLKYEEILSAMGKGDLYSSSGPLINEMYIENNVLTINCSEVSQIILNTERRYSDSVKGDKITTASFDLSDYLTKNAFANDYEPRFIRIIIKDNNGRKAWTRAYFYNEIIIN